MSQKYIRRVILVVVVVVVAVVFWTATIANAASDEECDVARRVRAELLADPYRPHWHLVLPEGTADPFDPNAAIYKDGVYHLWYIYEPTLNRNVRKWVHVSSIDLIHWRWHSFELQPEEGTPEKSINSGNAFFTHDGRVAISYQGVDAGGNCPGNCLIFSSDPNLEHWTRSPNNPNVSPISDTHVWFENGRYYLISGGKMPTLFEGDTCDGAMTEVGPFLSRHMPEVEDYEDMSCPDFFQLGERWVLLGLSHQKGVRYYTGTWNGRQFTPESHHRMNWGGGCCFAPETCLAADGRRLFWAWLRPDESATFEGIMSMPRVLTLADNAKSLRINPACELESLRIRPQTKEAFSVAAGETVPLENIRGNSLELDVVFDPGQAKKFGVKVLMSDDNREETGLLIDLEQKTLTVDVTRSSLKNPKYHENFLYRTPNPEVTKQVAPLAITEGEKIRLRVFLDKSVLEVFVNECQCVSQLVYPTLPDAVHVAVFAEDAPVTVDSVHAWELFPANPW